jgi:hypothetical protein
VALGSFNPMHMHSMHGTDVACTLDM